MATNPKSLNIFSVIKLSLILALGVSSITHSKMSLEDAAKLARNQTNGKVLSAKTRNIEGQHVHRIQVLTPSGRVKILHIPAGKPNREQNNFNSRSQNYQYSNRSNRSNQNRNPQPRQNQNNRSRQQPSRPAPVQRSAPRSNNQRSREDNNRERR